MVDLRARAFQEKLRAVNSSFAFTSMQFKPPPHARNSRGIMDFQIHEAVYHNHGPLQPEAGQVLAFAQLYLFDPEAAGDQRLGVPGAVQDREFYAALIIYTLTIL